MWLLLVVALLVLLLLLGVGLAAVVFYLCHIGEIK